MRPITAQPIAPKRDAFSPQRVDADSFHNQIPTRDLEIKISSKLLEEKQFGNTTFKKNIESYASSNRHISHTDSADLTTNGSTTDPTNDLLSFYTDKEEDDLSVEDNDDSTPIIDSDHLDKDTSIQILPHAKLGIGVGIVLPPVVTSSEPVTSVTDDSSTPAPAIIGPATPAITVAATPATTKFVIPATTESVSPLITEAITPAITEPAIPISTGSAIPPITEPAIPVSTGSATPPITGSTLSPMVSSTLPLPSSEQSNIDALSSAVSALLSQGDPEIANNEEVSLEEIFSSQDTKTSSSEQEKGAPLSSLLRMNSPGSDTKGNTSLSASTSLAQSLPAPVAMAVRTARFSDFLTELTATVDRARLNTSQNMTLQLRSDVLEGTNIHISGDATHINVVFSTVNAASNALLNTHLGTLQNHLTALCPGQFVDIKMTPMAASSSSNFGDKDDSSNDLASFDQGNRGNSRNNDDVL